MREPDADGAVAPCRCCFLVRTVTQIAPVFTLGIEQRFLEKKCGANQIAIAIVHRRTHQFRQRPGDAGRAMRKPPTPSGQRLSLQWARS